MVATPFSFYRGAAAVMAADLAAIPRTGLTVQLCGDAHLSNFGAFAAPDRRLVFSINDFDETLPGPFEWDLKRLVGSLAVAGRTLGFTPAQRSAIELAAAQSYREAMRDFSPMGSLELWYTRLDVDDIAERYGAEAGARELRAFQQGGDEGRVEGQPAGHGQADPRRRRAPAVHQRPADRRAVRGARAGRRGGAAARARRDSCCARTRRRCSAERRVLVDRFRFADIARKVVGVGSVGTRTWVVLMLGRDDDDPLLLQVKEAEASVLEPYLGRQQVPPPRATGRRGPAADAGGQRHPPRLGPGGRHRAGGRRDFFVRQLWDKKGSVGHRGDEPPGACALYGRFCGWTLARAHARSGDSVAIAAYLGTSDVFDRAMADFAESYADQNAHDHAALQQAIAAGEIVAQLGI